MPISRYLAWLRSYIGHALVVMPSVGAVIHDEAGRILLAQNRDTGGYMLPGGAIDPGESPRQAVVREVREETGLDVEPESIAAVIGPWHVRYPNGDAVDYTATLFYCRITGGTLAALDGEATGFQWCLPEGMPRLGYPEGLWTWKPGDPPLF